MNNEERATITFTRSQTLINFEMRAESEFSSPHAIVRTRHISTMNGVVNVYYNTYYIYCERYPDCALWVFLTVFPCEPVWSWENE